MKGANQASPNRANGPTNHKEVGDSATKEGQGLSQEGESRMHEIAEGDIRNKGNEPSTEEFGSLKQQQQQPPPGPIVLWERFLPVRTLRVLLVENDHSTRQVVSALLRNCSYEVISAPNGVQAWRILGDLTNHIDLVLTEVVMPCVSGINLLDKIMNHKTHKNIPVVMMSSSDSMGTVFKCLSKGAVDFLVKPIRKNELKNLWQHVWRRCHSSSGSGSESGTQAQKSVKPKSADDSENDSGSNDDDDNLSSGMNARDGSDNGSGTQSSWTKCAVELESPQCEQFAEPPDSTCAQVIHPNPKSATLYEDLTLMNVNKEIQGQMELADHLMGKNFEICMSKDRVFLGLENNDASDKPSIQAANFLGSIGNDPDIPLTARDTRASNQYIKVGEGLDQTNDSNLDASLELSLKRLRSIADGGTTSHDDRNVLRRSEQSAFTRYHASVASNPAANGCGGSCVPFDNSSGVKEECTYNKISRTNKDALKQGSNDSNNINDMCSTAKNVFPILKPRKDNTSISAGKCIHPKPAFHPVELRASQENVQEKAEEKGTDMMIGKSSDAQPQVQVEHHHHHYHHYHHHHIHNGQEQQHQQQPQPDQDSFSLKDKTVSADCGLSDKFVPIEGNAANYSVIGSNFGSNHGSNGNNGSCTAVKVLNIDSVNGTTGHVGLKGGSGSGSGIEQQQSSRREAALKKFRQKRKERNFGKKVRYQSRKRLAEQRPRVRGQFARQNVQEQTDPEAEMTPIDTSRQFKSSI